MSTDNPSKPLIVYGHDWCALAGALHDELTRHGIPFEWRDPRSDPQHREALIGLTGGNLSVPTVIFPDGDTLIEPHPNTVLERLGIETPGIGERLLDGLRGLIGR